MSYEKVIVIGLDGADWRLVEPWIENGELPTLTRLVKKGAKGPLRSTIRPESSLAWSSFSTGVNPGKHGVFGFAGRIPGSYSFRLNNASHVNAIRLWDIIGHYGLPVGVLNVPFTYPPTQVNGYLVGGMLTPSIDSEFTFPAQLKQALLEWFPEYEPTPKRHDADPSKLFASVRSYTEQQKDVAIRLLHEYPWNFFAMVFTGPDRLQHFFWTDPTNAGQSKLLDFYRILDQALKEILESVTDRTLVVLLSDHGFNGCDRKYYVNQWLQEHGWLYLKASRHWWGGLHNVLTHLGKVQWLRRLKRALLPTKGNLAHWRLTAETQMIDWDQTRAFMGQDGGIWINLAGRDPQGIVKPGSEYETIRVELGDALSQVKDPATGRPAIAKVYMREELYHGPYAQYAPDLIIEPQRSNPDPAHNVMLSNSLTTQADGAFGMSTPYTGNHDINGILCMAGPGIVAGAPVENAFIWDLAPTILQAMGLPIPHEMDGRVLAELFEPGWLPETTSQPPTTLNSPTPSESGFNQSEQVAVENRLRDLGYLD